MYTYRSKAEAKLVVQEQCQHLAQKHTTADVARINLG